ncbi:hypothetical protein ElyMa_004888400 [Elysia marginata]|uniref:Uncharacterized protein n=1 Tax=Elysia marginata TaxID=1093978 RepID=A0AAV4IT62_9GAST|nr:hypothetical protein ElyMa_004888400 [Elysia marginata]
MERDKLSKAGMKLYLTVAGNLSSLFSVTVSPQTPQQTSTFEAFNWVPILQVDGLGKVRVNWFPKAIATWHGRESNPRPPDLESDALTTPPRCPIK